MKPTIKGVRINLGILAAFNLALIVLASAIAIVNGLPDYLYLNANGGSMYPAIKDGDQVKVKLCVDGDQMEVGDIIVYCSIAAGGVYSGAMWIDHRVIQKYQQEGKWYFKTQGDNCSEPDPWIVPEHFLLGKVVNIIHTGKTTQNVQEPQTTYKPPSFSYEFKIYSWIGIGVIGFGSAGITIIVRERAKRIEMLRKSMVLSCQTCTHFQIHRTYSSFITNGKFGIQTKTHLPRGLCKKTNHEIINCYQKPTCKNYTQK